MKKIFVGCDPRSMISAWVCMSSITRHSSSTVAVIPLIGEQTPVTKNGLTSFTYARYAVPYLCDYEDQAIFMDSDIIVRDDINKLFDLIDVDAQVSVVKKDERFEWAAVMGFNNELCTALTIDFINDPDTNPATFEWAHRVGDFPKSWGFLCDYDNPTNTVPSLIHYTSGTPAFLECRNVDYADLWMEEYDHMLSTCSWLELMGNSVHTKRVTSRMKWNVHDYLEPK